MEIRNIDPKDSKSSLHAGALGTAKIVRFRQLRRVSLPQVPAPTHNHFEHLMERAIQNAGVVDHRHLTSHRLDPIDSDGPPATYHQNAGRVGDHSNELECSFRGAQLQPAAPSYFVTKDDSGREVWWNMSSRSFELKDRAGKAANRERVPVRGKLLIAGKETETELSDAGEQGGIRGQSPRPERPSFVGSIISGGIPAAVPDSHHAEIVRTDSGVLLAIGSRSAPGNPAPIQINQHAEATGGSTSHFLQKNHPQRVFQTRRPAPTNDKRLESVEPLSSPLARRLQSLKGFLQKLLIKLWKKSAYHDKTKVRVNGKWLRREDYERIK